MAASSPSEFLTFYRRAASSALHSRAAARTFPARSFMTSVNHRQNGQDDGNIFSSKGTQQDTTPDPQTGGSREHVVEKAAKGDPNVQSHASQAGQASRAEDAGGQATRQRDEAGAKAKAEKEFPEAPTLIGMEDERGGKGT